MAIHKPWDRSFFVMGGSVMKNGFSLNLAEGQFGIFNVSKQTPKGAVAVESFKGYGKDTLFELRLGNRQKPTRTTSDKMQSSFPFSLNNVLKLHVSAPKRTEISVDELVIGYNGIDPKTSIQLYPGEYKEINIQLEGKALEYLGVPEGIANIIVPLNAANDYGVCSPEVDPCSTVDMLPIINEAYEYLRNYEFRGGTKLTDLVEVTPVIALDSVKREGELVEVKYCMTACDTGDTNALALVQQQYPGVKVSVKERKGALTTYEVTLRQVSGGQVPSKPSVYRQTLPSLIKGCKECPSGYKAVEGGFVYAVLLEDEGSDKSSVVEGLSNAVSGTALKGEGQDKGVGMYTVVLSKKLSDADFKSFIDQNPTATIQFVNEVSAICNNNTVTETSWSECGRCTFTSEKYVITLPDNECGESRLTELNQFYPDLVVTETGVKGGCQRQYTTSTTTNVVCKECDPMYQDTFRSEAPQPFDGVQWTKVEESTVDGTRGKYGFRLKGKVFKMSSGECLRDMIGYREDSVRIKATGGYITDFNWSTTNGRVEDRPFHVSYISHYEPRTHVAGNMLNDEKESRTYFTGRMMNYDYMGRILSGNESKIFDLDAQFVDYAITIERSIFSQGLSQRLQETITYHVLVEVGRHQDVEDVLNALAAANGIEGVKAFPTV